MARLSLKIHFSGVGRALLREVRRGEMKKIIYGDFGGNCRRSGFGCWHPLSKRDLAAQRSTDCSAR